MMTRIQELEKQIQELQQELEFEKQKTEIEYPFEEHEHHWVVYTDGDITDSIWINCESDTKRYDQGNIFKTEQEAVRESEKRALLTRFRQFRDKCNGDWKPDFNDDNSWKYCIAFNHNHNMLKKYSYLNIQEFHLFGYFKKESDAERAIQLFGDEIKRLYVEE